MQDNLEKVSGEKSNLDEVKSKNLQQMSIAVQELHDKISMKKIDLAPLVKSKWIVVVDINYNST